jgi:hypothetical protein
VPRVSIPLRTAVIPLFLLIAVASFSLETHVIPASDLRKRVPMTAVFYERASFNPPVRTSDFIVTELEDGSKLARGRDKSGKPWRAVLPAPTRGLWKTDVNGTRTYYFAGYTGGAGMAPDTWILVLSFDEQGRPIPFYVTTSHADYDSKGISDILNLDGTGAELLQQNWAETDWMPGERSGYYITTLYQQRGIYWYRTDGQHGARTFPLYEKWVNLPNTHPQLVEAPELSSWLADSGNDPRSGTSARILSVDKRGIHAGPELGCELQSIGLIVEDSKAGRQIEADYFLASSPLLAEIAHDRLPVTFTGMKRWPNTNLCDASIVWASKE